MRHINTTIDDRVAEELEFRFGPRCFSTLTRFVLHAIAKSRISTYTDLRNAIVGTPDNGHLPSDRRGAEKSGEATVPPHKPRRPRGGSQGKTGKGEFV